MTDIVERLTAPMPRHLFFPLADALCMEAATEITRLRQLLSEAEKEARAKALEEAAKVSERDVDWSAFGKRDIQPWENGDDSVRDYRLGIAAGRAIAAAIRALQSEER
ncbi:hypothetical protein DXT96_06870 [Agrobacterium sp. ICMP 6402]|uniref:hypothetical protein n=1 Tax=Agrobacterium sp. ICMP 6402 TaxID=2292443 RepID=UPI0012968AC6|nr:hypothetical protein [Agrobacterium sp. ICMP 6402]MQB09577.1 hypothetical protein [Agrobacterium sp. ICMP 6402]